MSYLATLTATLALAIPTLGVAQTTLPVNTFTGGPSGTSTDWFEPANWLLSRVPLASDIASVPAGKTVALPGSTVDATDLAIDVAALYVSGTVSISLQTGNQFQLAADRIQVDSGGVLSAGTAAAPILGRLTILLTADSITGLAPSESKQMQVRMGGTLKLYGAPCKPWCRLKDGATWQGGPGSAAQIDVEDPATGWVVGNRLAVASTDFASSQVDDAVVQALTGATDRFTLTAPMAFRHYSKRFVANNAATIDMRAPVAMLDRTIRVLGDTDATKRWGGDLFIGQMPPATATTTAEIHFVEFEKMGKHGQLGRYPVHFHMCEDHLTSSSQVRGCSIHHCFNRGIVVHNTFDLHLTDNVVYDTFGHAYMLEDGSEVGNILQGNLGMRIRAPNVAQNGAPAAGNANKYLGRALYWGNATASFAETVTSSTYKFFKYHDQTPSVFWMANYANQLQGNVAAGSEGYGFVYDMQDLDYDASGNGDLAARNALRVATNIPANQQQRINTQPQRTFLFVDNAAHSCERVGFFSDDDAIGRARPVDVTVPRHFTCFFDGCTASKCRFAGIWYRQYGQFVWRNCRLSDNALGVYFGSEGHTEDDQFWQVGMPSGPAFHDEPAWNPVGNGVPGAPSMSHGLLVNSVIVGDSDNLGHDPTPAGAAPNADWFDNGQAGGNAFARSLPYRRTAQFTANFFVPYQVLRTAIYREIWCQAFMIYDGLIGVVDTHFEAFRDRLLGASGPTRHTCLFSTKRVGTWEMFADATLPLNPWAVDPRNYAKGVTRHLVDHVLGLPQHLPPRQYQTRGTEVPDTMNWFYGCALNDALLHDLDGSVVPGASGERYVANANNPLLFVGMPSVTHVNAGDARFAFKHAAATQTPICSVQLEWPWDHAAHPAGFPTSPYQQNHGNVSHLSSLFCYLQVENSSLPTGARAVQLFDMFATETNTNTEFHQVRSTAGNENLKRRFACNLAGSLSTPPIYHVSFHGAPNPATWPTPPTSSDVLAPSADFVVRLRFGAAGASLVLAFPFATPPIAVFDSSAPTVPGTPVPGTSQSTYPSIDTFFNPSTGTRLYPQTTSLTAVGSLALLTASGQGNGWFHGNGTLYVRLRLPTRSGGNACFTGSEALLYVKRN